MTETKGEGLLMKVKDKLEIDVPLFLFLCLLVFTLLEHIIQCINFLLLNGIMNGQACFLLALLIFLIFIFIIYKMKIICLHEQRFDKLDIFFLGIFLFYYLMKIPFPDTAHDTMSGEIFVGKFAFTSKVLDMKPFLPMTTGWFSLSNRIFYYFRLILGYRLSTVINFFVIYIAYYKTKELLLFLFNYVNNDVFKNMKEHTTSLIISFVAFASLYKEYIILGQTVIKGDIFVIPLFLECVLLLLNMKNTTKEYAYAGLLIGLSVALKLTNIAFFIPIVIYFVIKELKNIKIKNLLFTFIFFIVPILPYVVYNIVVTGNPIFPFYNNLFKSPYYPPINFKDVRWGPKTVLETFFWPIFLLFVPEKTSELGFNSNSLAIGYLVIFLVIFLKGKVPLLQKLIPICMCLFLSIFLWSITTGYGRYMISLEVLSFIVLAVFVYTICCNKAKHEKSVYLIFAGCLAGLMSLSICTNNLTLSNWEWSWRPSIFKDKPEYIVRVIPNLRYILDDRITTDNLIVLKKFESVKTWVCVNGKAGYPTLANPDADFFYVHNNVPTNPAEFTETYFESRPKDGINVLSSNAIDENYFNILDSYNFVIVKYERFHLNFADANNPAWFFTLMTKNQAEKTGSVGLSFSDIK